MRTLTGFLRRRTIRRAAAVLPAAFCAVSLWGCGQTESSDRGSGYKVYVSYLNSEEDGIYKKEYEGSAGTQEELRDDLIALLQYAPENEEYTTLLPDSVKLQRQTLENKVLTLDFSPEYEEMDSTREVLARAGIVRTMVQLEDVSAVYFTVDGEPAHSPSGVELGVMDADSFVEDAGKQINAIQHNAINLYFANEDGTALHREARSIYYSASKPLEWAIVERIIAGPKVEGNFPTVPVTTQIISVSTAGGICYVNLTQTFVTNALNMDERLPVYSIVNSVTDNCRDVTAVQIAVDGDSSIIFRQQTDLSKPFEPDMDLVEES